MYGGKNMQTNNLQVSEQFFREGIDALALGVNTGDFSTPLEKFTSARNNLYGDVDPTYVSRLESAINFCQQAYFKIKNMRIKPNEQRRVVSQVKEDTYNFLNSTGLLEEGYDNNPGCSKYLI